MKCWAVAPLHSGSQPVVKHVINEALKDESERAFMLLNIYLSSNDSRERLGIMNREEWIQRAKCIPLRIKSFNINEA